LVIQTHLLVARARKQAPKTKRAGRNLTSAFLLVSAKRRGGKGKARLKRRKPASEKERRITAFLGEADAFCPGMGLFGHWEISPFAETTENPSVSGRNPGFFSCRQFFQPSHSLRKLLDGARDGDP